MNEGLDNGDIYQQLPMSLTGTLDDIFEESQIQDLLLPVTLLRGITSYVLKIMHNLLILKEETQKIQK